MQARRVHRDDELDWIPAKGTRRVKGRAGGRAAREVFEKILAIRKGAS
jgi:hypothetical protein